MLALVSNTAHNNPHLLYEQTLAYNRMLGDDCVHVININLRESQRFFRQADRLGIDFSRIGNLVFADPERAVCPPSTLGIHALNYAFASHQSIRADYVILHTSSDLPYRTGLDRHIRNFDIGQAPAATAKSQEWHSYRFASADSVLRSFIERLTGLGETPEGIAIPRARFEGSFYRWDLMAEVFFRLSVDFGFDAEHHWIKPYPMEEIVLPMMADHLSQTHDLRRTDHFVRVANKDGDRFPDLERRMPPSESHIPALASLPDHVFSFKFAPPADSPLRDWVFQQLGLDLDLRIRTKSEPV